MDAFVVTHIRAHTLAKQVHKPEKKTKSVQGPENRLKYREHSLFLNT